MGLYDTEREREQKQSRKMMRTGIIAAFSGGIGLATYLLQTVFGGMAPDAGANALINAVCLVLMAYTATIFAVFIMNRKILLKVNFVLLYLVIPCILLKIFADYL